MGVSTVEGATLLLLLDASVGRLDAGAVAGSSTSKKPDGVCFRSGESDGLNGNMTGCWLGTPVGGCIVCICVG